MKKRATYGNIYKYMVEVNSFITDKFGVIRTILGDAGLKDNWRNVAEHAQRIIQIVDGNIVEDAKVKQRRLVNNNHTAI